MHVRFGQVDLYETEHHVRMIRIIIVPVSRWLDDVIANVGVRFLKHAI